MAITALVISILALVVSGLAVFYTRKQAMANQRQATASETSTTTDTQRRHDELEPDWVPTLRREPGGQALILSLLLRRSQPLDSIEVTIFDTQGISFASGQEGVDPSAPAPVLSAAYEALADGDQARWRLIINRERSTELHIRVRSTSSGKNWKRALHIKAPIDITESIW